MEQRIGRLGFNYENERFGILSMDLWVNDGLHCGETIEVLINDEWIEDRIEMSRSQYYLVKSKIYGDDLERLKVKF